MARADLCPDCREKIHPFAATCPSCGTDLDAHRRRRMQAPSRRRVLSVPRLDADTGELLLTGAVLAALALYAPLFGAVFGLLVVWHAGNNGLTARRNVAFFCVLLALFDVVFPGVFVERLLF